MSMHTFGTDEPFVTDSKPRIRGEFVSFTRRSGPIYIKRSDITAFYPKFGGTEILTVHCCWVVEEKPGEVLSALS